MSGLRIFPIELHGWDASARAWNGPTRLTHSLKGCAKVVRSMRRLSGSWYGKLQAEVPGEPRLTFFACVHDLGDASLGVLDLEGSDGGPLHFVLVVPAQRRHRLRPDLAFEFTSFLHFLHGAESVGSELSLHDYLEEALRGKDATHLVFSIEARALLPEMQLLLAQQAERLAMSMIAALAEKDEYESPAAAAD